MSTVTLLAAFKHPDGTPLADAQVTATLTAQDKDADTGMIVPGTVTSQTSDDGELSIDLWPNSHGTEGSRYILQVVKDEINLQYGPYLISDTDDNGDPVTELYLRDLEELDAVPTFTQSASSLEQQAAQANADRAAIEASRTDDPWLDLTMLEAEGSSFPLVTLYAEFNLPDGAPLVDATVRCSLTTRDKDSQFGLIVPGSQEAVTSDAGTVAFNLWPNSRGPQGSQYVLQVYNDDINLTYGPLTVPHQTYDDPPIPIASVYLRTLDPAEPATRTDAEEAVLTVQAAVTQIDEGVLAATTQADRASEAAATATDEATKSEQSRQAAAVSEQNAKNSEAASQDNENTSGMAATQAGVYSSQAQASAISADARATDSETARDASQEAQAASELASGQSQTSAEQSEASAVRSASSASAANNSANRAGESKTHALNSEQAAAASEQNASDSEANAFTRSELATQEADRATQQANRSDAEADRSAQEAVSAGNSEQSAAASATAAKVSEVNSAVSEGTAISEADRSKQEADRSYTFATRAEAAETAAAGSQSASASSESSSAANAATATTEADRATQQADRSTSEADRAYSEAERAEAAADIDTSDFALADHTHDYLPSKTDASFTGDQLRGTTVNMLGGFIGCPAPEGEPFIHPSIHNDLGLFRYRGGTWTSSGDRITQTDMDTLTNGSGNHVTIKNSEFTEADGSFVLTLENIPYVMKYGTWLGIAFGAPKWACKYVKLEAKLGNSWTTFLEVTNNDKVMVAAKSHDTSAVLTGFRITLNGRRHGAYTRLHTIFGFNFASEMARPMLMYRDGGTFYDEIDVNGAAVYHENHKPTPADIGALGAADKAADADKLDGRNGADYVQAANAFGFEGLAVNGNNTDYLRTPENGLLPYRSGGSSALGTATWPFNAVHANSYFYGGVALDDRYAAKAHDHDTDYRPISWVPAWGDITGKPTSFTPSEHDHDTDYRPISWVPAWGDITGKPTSFTPSEHTHNWLASLGETLDMDSYADLTAGLNMKAIGNTTTGFPRGYGAVITVNHNSNRGFQLAGFKDGGLYVRGIEAAAHNGLNPWREVWTDETAPSLEILGDNGIVVTESSNRLVISRELEYETLYRNVTGLASGTFVLSQPITNFNYICVIGSADHKDWARSDTWPVQAFCETRTLPDYDGRWIFWSSVDLYWVAMIEEDMVTISAYSGNENSVIWEVRGYN